MPAPTPATIGKYDVLSELGRGAMGTVYKARDPQLERRVALKTMTEKMLLDPEMRERFYREAKAAARLQHPNIVTIYELGEFDGRPFIAMELLAGRPLSALIAAGELQTLAEKIRIVGEICRGLDYAHKRGVVHRDIKPGNVQILPDGTVKILDFGLALRQGTTSMTRTGLLLGTPNYMAPEQIKGTDVDHRADMWAVGVIVYELVSGIRPFDARTLAPLIYSIVHSPPPPLDAEAMALPAGLVRVVERTLSKEPDARYKDLLELGVALRSAVTEAGPDRASRAPAEKKPDRPAATAPIAVSPPPRPTTEALAYDAVVAQASALLSGGDIEASMEAARIALHEGNRTDALRQVDQVLSVDPGFVRAVELRQVLEQASRAAAGVPGAATRPISLDYRELASFGDGLEIKVIQASPDEDLLAVGGADGSVRLWNLATQGKLKTLRSAVHRRAGYESLITCLAFSIDGTLIASGHVDGAVHVFRVDDGSELEARLGHERGVGAVAFSPHGTVLATGGADSTLKLWDLDALVRGDARRQLIRQPAAVTALSYVHNGSLLASGHTNRLIRLHETSSGKLFGTLRGHQAAVTCLAAAADDNLLVGADRDRTLRLFDLQRLSEVGSITGHRKPVTSIAPFSDGRHLASVATENRAIVWNLHEATEAATLWGGSDETFISVQALGGGRTVACALADGRIRLWGE